MKTNYLLTFLLLMMFVDLSAQNRRSRNQETITTAEYGVGNNGSLLQFELIKGRSHNHPLIAIWLADEKGNFIQTLYVSESIGKGNFRRADRSTGMWQAGEIQRPAALPYWGHQRGIKNEFGNYLPSPANPETDARTGATPPGSFRYQFTTEKKLNGVYRVYVEINQSWDWNEHWFNAKFPDDPEYRTSSQPAIVYEAVLNTKDTQPEATFNPIGRSHHSGKDGKLYTDLNTLTTALNIVQSMKITFLR